MYNLFNETEMRKLFLMLIGFLLTSSLLAGPVGKDEAQSKALAFLNGRAGTASSGKAQAPRRLQDLSLATSNEAYFVFNVGTDGGFVMVSGSDLTPTILGYADEGTFDSSNMPDNMKAWLAGYEEQIKYMEAKGVKAEVSRCFLSDMWRQD